MGYAPKAPAMANCPKCNAPLRDERARFCAECGAMVPLSTPTGADPLLGKVIADRFRLVSVLGEGGMGKVYLAEQKMGASTRKVAVKTLHNDIASDPQVAARFQRECDTVNQLTHPNTITLYDYGEWEGVLYLAMEYLQGESVAQNLLRAGPLDPQRAERILAQVCGSLHEAHEAGIVHRDLKPENVLLTIRGGTRDFVKVLDFGIAKRNEGEDPQVSQKLTRQGMVLGTPPYMSPEQFTGQQLDRRSDLYSLGVMAYEMLTGKLPFEAKTPWEWATKHLTQAPEPIEVHDKAGKLLARHKSAIMKALSKNREQRQGSVLEFLQELTAVADPSMAWAQVSTPAPVASGGLQTPAPMPVPQTQVAAAGSSPQFPATAWVGGSPTPSGSLQPTPMSAGGSMVSAPMPQVPSSGGGGKGIIIGAVVLVLLATAGVGVWWATRPPVQGPVAPPPVPPIAQNPPQNVLPPQNPPPQNPQQVTIAPVGPGQVTITPVGPENPPPETPEGLRPVNGNPPPPPPPVEPEEPPPTKRPPVKNGPSPADLQRGRQIAVTGVSAARLGNLDAGLSALREATRLAGRSEPTVAMLRQTVSVAGAQKIGLLLQQRRCMDAQLMFTRLRTAGAGDLARRHFTPDCPAR